MELDDSNSDEWSDLDEDHPALVDASSEDEMVAARPLAETDSDISSSDDEDVHTSSGFANLIRSFANLSQIQAHLSRERELAMRMDGLIPGATPPGEERKAKKEQKMQEESSRAQDTALTSLHFSTERATIRYQFMAKLEASLQQQKAGEKVLRKDVWVAFQEAEAAAKFTTAKGKSGINRESDVAQIMSWGDYMKKWHLLDVWRDLEVGQEGKTPLYYASFATTFVALVNTGQDEASYVLQQLKKIYLQDPRGKAQLTKKKLLDAKTTRMKAIVKTLDLQFLWCKSLIVSCEAQLIQAPLKMQATPPLADPTRRVITDPMYPYLYRVVITTIPTYDMYPMCHGPSRGH